MTFTWHMWIQWILGCQVKVNVLTCDYIDFWTLCFAHHFVYWCHFTRFLIKFFACLYLTTMQILWARKYEYGVLFITHAREIFKSFIFDSWLKYFSSICDEQNTILTFPPHSIYTMLLDSLLGAEMTSLLKLGFFLKSSFGV